ncbi:hypothetical protein F4780DRAFT_278221 [Xylariomycetidae sp. FL0641]|nr:hypothetical protein F4780DRAFT_278221 [Xylariomycetidae sp. FL0641]
MSKSSLGVLATGLGTCLFIAIPSSWPDGFCPHMNRSSLLRLCRRGGCCEGAVRCSLGAAFSRVCAFADMRR